jgi:hypothetical protein
MRFFSFPSEVLWILCKCFVNMDVDEKVSSQILQTNKSLTTKTKKLILVNIKLKFNIHGLV